VTGRFSASQILASILSGSQDPDRYVGSYMMVSRWDRGATVPVSPTTYQIRRRRISSIEMKRPGLSVSERLRPTR